MKSKAKDSFEQMKDMIKIKYEREEEKIRFNYKHKVADYNLMAANSGFEYNSETFNAVRNDFQKQEEKEIQEIKNLQNIELAHLHKEKRQQKYNNAILIIGILTLIVSILGIIITYIK